MHTSYLVSSLVCESPVPEIIDLVFTKTSSKRSFSMTENERFGPVFANTGSTNSGTVCYTVKAARRGDEGWVEVLLAFLWSLGSS
jgi:hypothetical protein